MSVKNRIKEYIKSLNIATSTFEESIGASNGYINSISKNIGLDKLTIIIEKYSNLSIEWLLLGKGEMLKDTIQYATNITHRTPQIVTIDSHSQDNIALVPQTLKAGYLSGYNDPNFIKKLPSYRMPGLNNGVFRMFEVEGNSMFPTLPNKSYVVGQFVDNWETGIKDNQIYAIISNEIEDGLIKRCTNRIKKYNNLICKSDNRRNFPTQNIEPSSIKEIWEIKLHLNFQLPDPADIYDRMNDLEAEIQEIKRKQLY
ncbi:phage repressor protein C with HTH and peptisase S24 domain [Chryseobacterium sp. 52]|uniref:S24 family peptidase n=1 Tax=Chryseobacterium sp. 52 TaxID=2035213 RepID=UPI000C1A6807|nr:S24/S26 family peptidase [Chryseobacterium sp. 52]PIF44886.1 phage repressor protein C with HTH and peptisase S24 domain [Chryseobacterium sp. 52]